MSTALLRIFDEIAKIQNRVFQEDSKLQKVDIDIENMQQKIYENPMLYIDYSDPDYINKNIIKI